MYSSIRGTSDFDGSDAFLFGKVNLKSKFILKSFGYEEIILPLLEEEGLFAKGVGQGTDIVERQMFKIEGKDIVLRPEGTAQVVRYYLQNSLNKKSDFYKFFYTGAMFRGERPQKGRLRQFHHIGAEAIGSNSFYLDAEIIDLSLKILDSVGLKERKLIINSLGCKKDKDKFIGLLKADLDKRKKYLCEDCHIRLNKNPLRVLDCKNEECRKQIKSFMKIDSYPQDYLCPRCFDDYKNLIGLLDDLSIKYILDPCLVRGLDYYTNTVFEITSLELGAQNAIGAGGRYNGLIKSLGGPDIPAVGFALGVERILLALGSTSLEPALDIFVVVSGRSLEKVGFQIVRELREAGVNADLDFCGKSLKGQMRLAQKKKASFALIIGEQELAQGSVLFKNMVNSQQEKVARSGILDYCEKNIIFGERGRCQC
ncbi:MAG: histidine--tRNA ligase [Candidatus Omnitrophica bacterium]|nr:histidine--tRNA ligase [Candidatus Omnitrophota bacterium]MDD5430242.1 histidine--tRNA ligase [Candidatus Omnitrophota bacterium]